MWAHSTKTSAYSTRHIFRFVHRKTISHSRFNRGGRGGSLFSLFYFYVPECFLFFHICDIPPFFLLSHSLSLLSFLRYLACRQSRRNSRSKVHSWTQFLENISAVSSPPRRTPKRNEGWKFTRHGFRSSFTPRSYGSRRSFERMVRMISRLDISLFRPSGRQLFFLRIYLSITHLSFHGTFYAGIYVSMNRSYLRKYRVFIMSRWLNVNRIIIPCFTYCFFFFKTRNMLSFFTKLIKLFNKSYKLIFLIQKQNKRTVLLKYLNIYLILQIWK